uniref:Uncharacterized protein n=1 Tax=Zea mays TaxID=4577 RepID=A0A804MEJ0_MAIZE
MKSWSWRRAKARPPPRGSAHGSGAPSFWGSQPGRTPAAGGGGARRRGTSCRSGRRRPTRGPAPAASRSLTTPSRTRSRRSTPSSPTPSTNAAAGGGDNDGGDENVTAEKDDAESRELASMTKQISSWLQLKQQIRAPVSAASFQSSTKGPKSQQVESLECQQQVITRAGPEILGAQSKT